MRRPCRGWMARLAPRPGSSSLMETSAAPAGLAARARPQARPDTGKPQEQPDRTHSSQSGSQGNTTKYGCQSRPHGATGHRPVLPRRCRSPTPSRIPGHDGRLNRCTSTARFRHVSHHRHRPATSTGHPHPARCNSPPDHQSWAAPRKFMTRSSRPLGRSLWRPVVRAMDHHTHSGVDDGPLRT